MSRTIRRNIESELVGNPTLIIPEGMVPDHEKFIVNAFQALDADQGKISPTDHGYAAGLSLLSCL